MIKAFIHSLTYFSSHLTGGNVLDTGQAWEAINKYNWIQSYICFSVRSICKLIFTVVWNIMENGTHLDEIAQNGDCCHGHHTVHHSKFILHFARCYMNFFILISCINVTRWALDILYCNFVWYYLKLLTYY